MAHDPNPLKHLLPGWYAVVMGLSGLSLAWGRAVPLMGEAAAGAASALGALASLVFAVLIGATLMRARRHPQAWAEDRRHPVRHTFIAALPISIILLATVALAQGLPREPTRWLWWTGSLMQLFVTLWVVARWWNGPKDGGLQWASATPALFIPIVGNVLVPLAGVPLGHTEWAAAQFGIGLMFWPALLALVTLVILALLLATLSGLRDGSLLAPEPVAAIMLVPSTVPLSPSSALESGESP